MANESPTVATCRRLAEPIAAELGLSLWDVRFVKEGADWFLRYIIDKPGGVTIDDCVALSRRMNPVLDEADPIPQSYCLEVESPGVERELVRPEHFAAYLGSEVTVRLIRPIDGVKEWQGTLIAYDDGTVTIGDADGHTASFTKKERTSVRLIDDWADDEG